ncbi:MAG: hypothetical protein GYA34_10495 [Chloroflexi bacterium]|nr:hypothetical protein [Chloroflexota bacterium]
MLDNNYWPSEEAFIPIDHLEQITDNRVRCSAVAICDDQGHPCNNFYQGQEAHFFYEFEILGEIGTPIGGLAIMDTMDHCIHGKNTLLYRMPAVDNVVRGTRIRFHQAVSLQIARDTYFLDVSFASLDPELYQQYCSGSLTFDEVDRLIHRHCRVKKILSFSIVFPPDGKSITYGVANLPGWSHMIPVFSGHSQTISNSIRTQADIQPTILHVTHWKAGSQWINSILQRCVPDLIVEPQVGVGQFLGLPVQQGKVYPTLYITRQQYDNVLLPVNCHHFLIFRDLRDTLVSAYYSFKNSHPILSSTNVIMRKNLESLNEEEGLIYLIHNWLESCAEIQRSWIESGESFIRFEELLEKDLEILESILLDKCHLPVEKNTFCQVVEECRFERLSGGRQRGEENVDHHYRKGVAGDWRYIFTPKVKDAFKSRFEDILILSGYENSMDW